MANTYAEIIAEIRSEVGDFSIKRFETADGDASTTVFQLQNQKISDESGTLVVKVGGVLQTLTTDYAVDSNIGQITFTSGSIPASGNDNISFEYESVNLTDADYIKILNNIQDRLRKKIWREFIDEDTLVTVAFQDDYDLSGIAANILSLIDVQFRRSSNDSDPWISLNTLVNVTFFRDLQKFNLKPTVDTADWEIRIRGIRAFIQATTTSGTFEPDNEYWPIINKFAAAEYFRREAAKRANILSAVSKEKHFEPANVLLGVARDYDQQAKDLLRQIRKPRPAKTIPIGIGK